MDLLNDDFDEDQLRLAMEESLRLYKEQEIPRRLTPGSSTQYGSNEYPGDEVQSKTTKVQTKESTTRINNRQLGEGPSTSIHDDGEPLLHNGEGSTGFLISSGSTWVYPTNYPERKYQFEIVRTALFHNTLVSLPTGLGKTFIAAVVMYNFYRWYPHGKIIFMAPTKPLVNQQIDACYKIMGIPRDDTAQLTGSVDLQERRRLWAMKRVFFLTPQTITNDLTSGICLADRIKCVVVDEAHKAQKNYAYVQFIQSLVAQNKNFRVLALSATPGKNIETVKEVVRNLLIGRLEVRSEDSPDISLYTHSRTQQIVVVPLGELHASLRKRFLTILDHFSNNLRLQKLIYSNTMTQFGLVTAMRNFQNNPPPGMNSFQQGQVHRDFNICIPLCHAGELLYQHGLRTFYVKMNEVLEDPAKGAAANRLNSFEPFTALMSYIKKLLGDDVVNHFDPDISVINPTQIQDARLYRVTHPKMEKLRDIVIDHFQACNDRGDTSSRVIVFAQYRDVVTELRHIFEQYRPLIKPLHFVGQSNSGKQSGLRQKDQLKIMADFRSGRSNTLIATCVGEEGLDIGEVDLIVCYDADNSPIRVVQRMGRTGRKRDGRVVQLLTQGKEEANFKNSMSKSSQITKKIQTSNILQEAFYKNDPRMIPAGMEPKCQKMHMTVAPEVPKPRASKSGDLRAMFNRKDAAAQGRSWYATDSELADMGWDGTVPEYDQLPETEYLATKYTRDELIEVLSSEQRAVLNSELPKERGLGEWIDWQRTLRCSDPTQPSVDSAILVDLLQLSDQLAQEETDCFDLASQLSATIAWPGKKKGATRAKRSKEKVTPAATELEPEPNDIRPQDETEQADAVEPEDSIQDNVQIIKPIVIDDDDQLMVIQNLVKQAKEYEQCIASGVDEEILRLFLPEQQKSSIKKDIYEMHIEEIAPYLTAEDFESFDVSSVGTQWDAAVNEHSVNRTEPHVVCLSDDDDDEDISIAINNAFKQYATLPVSSERIQFDDMFLDFDEFRKNLTSRRSNSKSDKHSLTAVLKSSDVKVEQNCVENSSDEERMSPSLLSSNDKLNVSAQIFTKQILHSPGPVSPILGSCRLLEKSTASRKSSVRSALADSDPCISPIIGTQGKFRSSARRRYEHLSTRSKPEQSVTPVLGTSSAVQKLREPILKSSENVVAANDACVSPIIGTQGKRKSLFSISDFDQEMTSISSPKRVKSLMQVDITSHDAPVVSDLSPIVGTTHNKQMFSGQRGYPIGQSTSRRGGSNARKSLNYNLPPELSNTSPKVRKTSLFSISAAETSYNLEELSEISQNKNKKHCDSINVEKSFTVEQMLYKINGTLREPGNENTLHEKEIGVDDDLFKNDDDSMTQEYSLNPVNEARAAITGNTNFTPSMSFRVMQVDGGLLSDTDNVYSSDRMYLNQKQQPTTSTVALSTPHRALTTRLFNKPSRSAEKQQPTTSTVGPSTPHRPLTTSLFNKPSTSAEKQQPTTSTVAHSTPHRALTKPLFGKSSISTSPLQKSPIDPRSVRDRHSQTANNSVCEELSPIIGFTSKSKNCRTNNISTSPEQTLSPFKSRNSTISRKGRITALVVDLSSDDDFEPPYKPASKAKKNAMLSKPVSDKVKILNISDDNNSEGYSNHRNRNPEPMKRKKLGRDNDEGQGGRKGKKRQCDFINNEAEESYCERRSSSDGDNTSGLDEFEDDSFVDDLSQPNQTQIVQAKYIESKIKNPVYQIRQPQNRVPFQNVFSQAFPEDVGSYIHDSFVNDEEEIEESEMSALELAELALKRERKEKRRRRDECNFDRSEENSIQKDSSLGNQVKKTKRRRIQALSSSSDEEEIVCRKIRDTTTDNNASSSNARIQIDNSKNTVPNIQEPSTNVDDYTDSINNYDWTDSDFATKTEDLHDLKEVDSDWDDDFVVPVSHNTKQPAVKKTDTSGTVKPSIPNSYSVNKSALPSAHSKPTPAIGYHIKINKPAPAGNHPVATSSTSETPCEPSDGRATPQISVIISTRQVSQAAGVVSALKVTHKMKVIAWSVADADYILSWRAGAVRIMLADLGKAQLQDTIIALQRSFQQAYLIVENNSQKPLCKQTNAANAKGMWNQRTGHLVQLLEQAQVYVYFAEKNEDTARVLAHLARKELKKGHSITCSSEAMHRQEKKLQFLQMLPGVNLALALKILQRCPNLGVFMNMSDKNISSIVGVPYTTQISHLFNRIC